MDKQLNRLIIDAGNTQVKVGVFQDGQIREVKRFGADGVKDFRLFLQAHQDYNMFLSSVRNPNLDLEWFAEQQVKSFDGLTKFPISIKYQTPETLGKDRIANAVAGYKLSTNKPALVIDLGTCIKFDVVDRSGAYLGGSISPGLSMRYAALNEFTGRLPLLQPKRPLDFIGGNTEESLHVGVVEAIQGEIERFIGLYEERFGDLGIFVTGGDAHFFDFLWKSNIFALENLTLQGLYYIAELND